MSKLEVTNQHISQIKIIMDVLENLVDMINLEFLKEKSDDNDSENEIINDDKSVNDNEGMRIMTIDKNKVLFINLIIYARSFVRYICNSEKINVGIELEEFNKILKTFETSDDSISLLINEKEKNILRIEKTDKTYFKLKLLTIEKNDSIKIPDDTVDAVIAMSTKKFHKICKEMSLIAENVEITCNSKQIIFACEGKKTERVTTLNIGDELAIKTSNEKIVTNGFYDLKTFNNFDRFQNMCDKIIIFMKKDCPLVLKYKIDDNNETIGKICIYISPKHNKEIYDNKDVEDIDYYSDDEIQLIE